MRNFLKVFILVFFLYFIYFFLIHTNKNSHYQIQYIQNFPYLYAYEEFPIKEAGTIEGKIIYNGNKIPSNKNKLITKDKEVCGDGYKVDEVYKINSKKEVEDVVVFIEDISKGKPFPKQEILLEQSKCEFKPRVVIIPVGAKFTIVNKDTVTHEANGILNFATIFQFAQPKQGMKDTVELKEPGIVSITCNIHGWMKAFGFVANNPYFSKSDKNGNFRITELPSGTYKLKIWHEKLKATEQLIEIKPNEVKKINIQVNE